MKRVFVFLLLLLPFLSQAQGPAYASTVENAKEVGRRVGLNASVLINNPFGFYTKVNSKPANVAADNVSYIALPGGNYLRRVSGPLNLDLFGANPLNTGNSLVAFNAVQGSTNFIELSDGTYRVQGSVTLPDKFDGKKGFINTTGVVNISNHTYQNITVNARRIVVSGTRLSTINYTCDTLDIDGFNDSYGCAWNRFINVGSNKTLVRITTNKGYVNFNWFDGGRLKVQITGTSEFEAHQNMFINADYTFAQGNGGFSQSARNRQANLLVNSYAEADSRIQGQVNILGLNYDSDQPPLVDHRNFILGTTDNIVRTSGDFLPISNNISYGDWSQLNASGYPVDVTGLGLTPVVQTDTTEISGLRKVMKISATSDFQGLQIKLPPAYTHADRKLQSVNLTLWYKGDDFQAGESFSADGTVYFGVKPSRADTLTGWKLLRLVVPASRSGNTFCRLYLQANKTAYVSTYYATTGKIAVLPSPTLSTVLVNGALQVFGKRSLNGEIVQQYTQDALKTYTVNFTTPLLRPNVTITFQPYDQDYNNIQVNTSNATLIVNAQGLATGFRFKAESTSGDWAARIYWKASEY